MYGVVDFILPNFSRPSVTEDHASWLSLFYMYSYIYNLSGSIGLKTFNRRTCVPLKILLVNTKQATETINPLSPSSDQHQFSPNDIHTMPRD